MTYQPFNQPDDPYRLESHEFESEHSELEERRQRNIRIALFTGAGVLAVAAIIALIVLGRRRPDAFGELRRSITGMPRRLRQRAESLQHSGPALIERSALRVEEAARELRGLAPALVEQKGREIEALGHTIRIEGARAAVRSADRLEDAARNVRRAVPPTRLRKAA
jgi:Sec-independent protein translocase protein TatA